MRYRFIHLLLGFTFITATVLGSSWLFTNGYNKHLAIESGKVERDISNAVDSISLVEANKREFNRIYELSITQPITTEHVRGEALRAVIDGEHKCGVWLINKHRFVENLRNDKHDLNKSRVAIWE